jgi:hypothetical protein
VWRVRNKGAFISCCHRATVAKHSSVQNACHVVVGRNSAFCSGNLKCK